MSAFDLSPLRCLLLGLYAEHELGFVTGRAFNCPRIPRIAFQALSDTDGGSTLEAPVSPAQKMVTHLIALEKPETVA